MKNSNESLLSSQRKGFGIVEAVMALLLLSIMLTAMLPAFAINMRLNTTSELRTGAIIVAQRELDLIRAGGALPATGSVVQVSHGGTSYQARLTHREYCADGICYTGARDILVEVMHNERPLYQVQTIFTSLDATGL